MYSEEAPPCSSCSAPERVDSPQAALLRDAIRRKQKVMVVYIDSHDNMSERTIWPIAVVYFDDARVLAGWCVHRSAFRHFRLEGLQVKEFLEKCYPGSRHLLVRRWRQQDRDGC
ncbi:helix-turn-helix transcriptional regulator [Pseudomonas syringae]|uniref:helix-turn-helix transcriptional regulator n=1 Tax=Pseudomonas syringae TaxID=317 RepID=UPI003B00226E